jgi:hypothetical protein
MSQDNSPITKKVNAHRKWSYEPILNELIRNLWKDNMKGNIPKDMKIAVRNMREASSHPEFCYSLLIIEKYLPPFDARLANFVDLSIAVKIATSFLDRKTTMDRIFRHHTIEMAIEMMLNYSAIFQRLVSSLEGEDMLDDCLSHYEKTLDDFSAKLEIYTKEREVSMSILENTKSIAENVEVSPVVEDVEVLLPKSSNISISSCGNVKVLYENMEVPEDVEIVPIVENVEVLPMIEDVIKTPEPPQPIRCNVKTLKQKHTDLICKYVKIMVGPHKNTYGTISRVGDDRIYVVLENGKEGYILNGHDVEYYDF